MDLPQAILQKARRQVRVFLIKTNKNKLLITCRENLAAGCGRSAGSSIADLDLRQVHQ
jgi:hypothetical protein